MGQEVSYENDDENNDKYDDDSSELNVDSMNSFVDGDF